jgi:hypothetical protein
MRLKGSKCKSLCCEWDVSGFMITFLSMEEHASKLLVNKGQGNKVKLRNTSCGESRLPYWREVNRHVVGSFLF